MHRIGEGCSSFPAAFCSAPPTTTSTSRRAAQGRPRPHGRGPLHRHPGRRVRLVHLGARERPLRPRLAAARPRRRPRTRHLGRPRHPDLRRPTVADPPVPRDHRRRRTGERIGWGARQEIDLTHPAFRFHAERIIRKIVARYAVTPPSSASRSTTNPACSSSTTTASSSASSTTSAPVRRRGDPQPRVGPGLLVAPPVHLGRPVDPGWQRPAAVRPRLAGFQARQVTEFIAWQADIVREYADPGHFVTTCISYNRAGRRGRRADRPPRRRHGQRVLRHAGRPATARPHARCHRQDWQTTGAWALYQTADRMYSSRQEPFLVTETNARLHRHPWDNRPAYDGQWRQAAWALRRRGARMIEYWHWHTLHFGAGDLLGRHPAPHRPARPHLRRTRPLGAEFEAGRSARRDARPRTPTSRFLLRRPSKWRCQAHPPLATPDGGPDPGGVRRHLRPPLPRRLRRRPSGPHPPRPPTARPARRPARADAGGGRGPAPRPRRPGVVPRRRLDARPASGLRRGRRPSRPRPAHRLRRPEARARTDRPPARLAGRRRSPPTTSSATSARRSPCRLSRPARSPARGRTAPALGGRPATARAPSSSPPTTTRTSAAGPPPPRTATAAAGHHRRYRPRAAFARALFAWAAPADPWRPSHPSVTSASATARDGRRVRFLHNWSWQPASVPVPRPVRDVLSDTEYAQEVPLGPWDVKVLTDELP
ncbi:hypothetical protein SALBM311S_05864 [Streptomyces alboniger]